MDHRRAKVRQYLIDLAHKEQTIGYQELSDKCGLKLDMSLELHRAEIGEILGDISVYEYNNGRPLLSSIVISKTDAYQGDGFFKLAEDLGFGQWRILKNNDFAIIEIKRTHDFWKDKSNYLNLK